MNLLIIVFVLAAVLAVLLVLEIIRELHCFTIRRYKVTARDSYRPEREIKALFLSDLHSWKYGKENAKLLGAIKQEKPDLILIGGDMFIAKPDESFETAASLVEKLTEICPVIYAEGNHEQRIKEDTEKYGNIYRDYKERLTNNGVIFLDNESEDFTFGGVKICICGLSLPSSTYRRFEKADLSAESIRKYLKYHPGREEEFVILLAHNPAYMDTYLEWGADLVLSGHLHGCLVRVPGLGGVVTPQGFLFPKYSGEFTKIGNQNVIVSRGLGTHTLNIRLFNTPEIVSVSIV